MTRRRHSHDRASTVTKENPRMSSTGLRNRLRKRVALSAAPLALALLLLAAAPAAAAPQPHLTITSTASPTHFIPGDTDNANWYEITVTNTGGASTDGTPLTIADTLPDGVTVNPVTGILNVFGGFSDNSGATLKCNPGQPAVCVFDQVLEPGRRIAINLPVIVDPGAPDPALNQATVSGGGVAPASTSETTPLSATPAGAGFQAAATSLYDAAGDPATQAGSHPLSLGVRFELNTIFNPAENTKVATPVATPRDLSVTLPRGVVVDPQATPVRCTAAELELQGSSCADSSAVGLLHTYLGEFGYAQATTHDPISNMVPSPGSPAELAVNVGKLGIYVHLLGRVDSAGDYSLGADVRDVPQFGNITGAAAELWGDPSDPAHDRARGTACNTSVTGAPTSCPVDPASVPFLTLPSACSSSLATAISVVPWEQSAAPYSGSAPVVDDQGNPQPITGCDQLAFDPTLTARPTTNVADSPTGLSVDLHVPQADGLDQLATSNLKKTVVTLPEGLVVNPSGANGLDACSAAQIGLTTPVGSSPVHFSADPPSCPDAAKIGTVEVDTPLLEAPLQGSVYIAKPYDNPFDSLLAIYIVVADPQTGVVIKLAGHVVPDPGSGRLVTTFDDNPELPFSDFKLSFFGGARGTLRTPSVCGDYSTTSQLTPWSGNAAATPHDDYSISQGPNGACPSSAGQQPNAPAFDAGTVSPLAGEYSPFVLNLDRADGSQQFSKVITSPPPGLVAKLAGTPACSDAALSSAASKTGQDELADPSCPSDSQVGTVHVAAGAGPSPYWTQGKAYMAGPYQGEPLSLAIITPATAGPFDLGTVVTRVALHVDPTTAQITATSDPIPSILQGIPLDVRSVQVRLDKPSFTLNGTSCDPSQVTGSLLSTLGNTAQLSKPFQLAECANLPFKPRLGMRLRGGHFRNGHPAFTSVLSARSGDANIGKASVILPPTMQLDQSHIQAPCTRPQFAAGQCPAASVIGSVVASSPLLDYKLTGPVYLRTGNNPLPDVVLALHGPASQPIEIDQVGKIDTVHARLRTTFQGIPDAPLSKAIIRLVGGHKGLLVNNTNLCKQPNRAAVFLNGHNNKIADSTPNIAVKCPKPRKKHRKHHKRHHRRHALRQRRAVG